MNLVYQVQPWWSWTTAGLSAHPLPALSLDRLSALVFSRRTLLARAIQSLPIILTSSKLSNLTLSGYWLLLMLLTCSMSWTGHLDNDGLVPNCRRYLAYAGLSCMPPCTPKPTTVGRMASPALELTSRC